VFSNILGNSDLPVRVAINRERVHVIDDNKNVCICCTTTRRQLGWVVRKPVNANPGLKVNGGHNFV